ncbi:hypothetical protein TUSST3_25060 [Streptomyces sp. TUS-ST3]|nr:hypothetical protein TUSST3_25060 [Streptomyces sp. TUS-ST3]
MRLTGIHARMRGWVSAVPQHGRATALAQGRHADVLDGSRGEGVGRAGRRGPGPLAGAYGASQGDGPTQKHAVR